MITTVLNLLKPVLEILLILWAALAVGADLFAQLCASVRVISRGEYNAAAVRRTKTLLLLGGVIQWFSCALFDLIDMGRYASSVTAFLFMADTLISMLVILIISFGSNVGGRNDFFWVTQFTRIQYLLSIFFGIFSWLAIIRGGDEKMWTPFVDSIHQFMRFFLFGALIAAVIAIVASFIQNDDATATAKQVLVHCFVFGLILLLLGWLFS